MELFIGKGGVGKTTLACATALAYARQGRRVLLASLDQAHSLGDALGFRFQHQPGVTPGVASVQPGLDVIEVDSLALLEDRFRGVVALAAGAGHDHGFDLSALDPAELTGLPGVQEILALLEITDYADAGRWDVIILDCPPSADMLRIITAPDMLLGYLERVWPAHNRTMTAIGGDLKRALLAATVQEIASAVTKARDLIADRERTGAKLVTAAEQVAVAESARVRSAAALLGLRLDAVLVNKVLPELPAPDDMFAPGPATNPGDRTAGPNPAERTARPVAELGPSWSNTGAAPHSPWFDGGVPARRTGSGGAVPGMGPRTFAASGGAMTVPSAGPGDRTEGFQPARPGDGDVMPPMDAPPSHQDPNTAQASYTDMLAADGTAGGPPHAGPSASPAGPFAQAAGQPAQAAAAAHPAVQWYSNRRGEQLQVVAELRRRMGGVGGIRVAVIAHAGAEPVGLNSLSALSYAIDASGNWVGSGPVPMLGSDADGVLSADGGPVVRLESEAGVDSVFAMRMHLPVVDPSTLQLGRVEDDLIVGADGVRRRLRLAPVLRRCTVEAAELDGEQLVIRFRPDPQVWPK
ncbi:ArsA family ATPase [Nocardia huaxiensis]|nr:ArsA family ATPase [Nocardia huaxiensis]